MKPSGLLVIDKPRGLTSRAVVDRALGWFPTGTRLGHTGTLDPLATGVLVLCVGVATRLGEYVQRMTKTYQTGLLLGARSDSADADGVVVAVPVHKPPELTEIGAQLQGFLGVHAQVPPAFSAARVGGQRAYKLARRGQAVALEPRLVHIHDIELVSYAYPRLDLLVRCGKGTYIRALARDLGERLGCGALVESLRRTRVGPFDAADALTLDADPASAQARLLPLAAAVAELPRLTLPAAEVSRLRQGQALAVDLLAWPNQPAETSEVAVFDDGGSLSAVAHFDHEQMLLRPEKVMP